MPSTSTATEQVLGALSGRTGLTAAEIALDTGIGRSTATKALASLEAKGKAHRVAGGRDGARRMPDRWSIPSGPSPRRKKAARGGPRLGKGELAGLVLGHLRVDPSAELTPTGVAKALGGRSTGAVANALERLVRSGEAVKVSDGPRRYRAGSTDLAQK